MFRFADPEFFLLFLCLGVLMVAWRGRFRLRSGAVRFSDLRIVKGVGAGRGARAVRLLRGLRLGAVAFMILAVARPQFGTRYREIITQGIDIILAIDVSGSMEAEDFKPKNRLHVVKEVVKEFIAGREHDRIGMVVFATRSFTQCPLTLDYGILTQFLDQVEIGMIDESSTAIGMALANSVNRLRHSDAKSKVIILLTDGVNNAGEIDPIHAAELAKSMSIKVYTIGAGTRGTALFPVNDPLFGKRYVRRPVEIDEQTLKRIAEVTDGQYFRATDADSLRSIYEEIGQLEKTEIKSHEYIDYQERFELFLIIGLALLGLEVLLSQTRYRRLP
ncbi:VWA domain-containing protein [bacterium]|nr:VWA domain-containing protein [candidate division CSSED10-310 bacterium]